MSSKMNTKSKITSNHISLTMRAALRHGKELSRAEANNHASKILEWMSDAHEDDYGQEFWEAAKKYFLD